MANGSIKPLMSEKTCKSFMAATSLEKNLCSIVTVVLLDSQESTLSIDTIAERIKEKFSLDFDCGEIRNAIIKKGNGSVTLDNIGASLTTPARLRFEREDTLQQRLSLSISRFMSEYSLKADFNFENLVVSYIYHSFNTNTIRINNGSSLFLIYD